MRRFFSFLMGALTGALVGATVALLLAPSSGEELQTRARERFTTVTDEVRQAYEGRAPPCTVERAGGSSGKNSAYTCFILANWPMSTRNTVVLTTWLNEEPPDSRILPRFSNA